MEDGFTHESIVMCKLSGFLLGHYVQVIVQVTQTNVDFKVVKSHHFTLPFNV
jgi:hypothetical protein